MYKNTVGLFLACLFLLGSTLLPLGDFSLMQDIPGMYRNYSHITTAEELGVIDFVGDYLLHGKELFGNNRNDKPQTSDNGVQFQHQANSLQFILLHLPATLTAVFEFGIKHPLSRQQSLTSDYYCELFRPPLA